MKYCDYKSMQIKDRIYGINQYDIVTWYVGSLHIDDDKDPDSCAYVKVVPPENSTADPIEFIVEQKFEYAMGGDFIWTPDKDMAIKMARVMGFDDEEIKEFNEKGIADKKWRE